MQDRSTALPAMGAMTMPAANESVLELFFEQADNHPNRTAALRKTDGSYHDVTWSQMAEQCRAIAASLVASKLAAGDRVGLISHTRLEWVDADLGILAAGGVTVPVYPTNLANEIQFVLEHSGARCCFVEDASQSEKCLEIREQIPAVETIVQITGTPPAAGKGWVLSFEEFLALGATVENVSAELETRRAALDSDSILTLIYTSGTTGRPKGVVLTHGAMVSEANAVIETDLIRASDTQLLFLPLAHVFAKVLEICWLRVGHIMAFAENMTTVKANLAETKPSVMAGVPRVFEKFHTAVVEKGSAATGLKLKLFQRALELSERAGEATLSGTSLGLRDSIQFALLRKIIFAKIGAGIREILGGRMRVLISGGAPLSPKIGYFFEHAGIEILEGYGLTETCAGTVVNRIGKNLVGTVGTPIPNMELKIASDGEVLIKGPAMLREYWNDPESTQAAIVDGWFHTGDIGEIDAQTGALRITDRKKDIIVTAGGKNVAPQKIEGIIKVHKLVSQVVVHGDRRKFLSALLTLDPDQLATFAREHGLEGDYAQWCSAPEVEREVSQMIDEVNRSLPTFEQVKKFKILDQDFSVETGELTPKLSVKRKVVNTKYGHYFDAFYAETY